MNFKTTIGLLVLLVVVAIAAAFLLKGSGDADLGPTDVMDKSGSGAIFSEADFPKDDLASISIAITGGRTIEITRDGENWTQTEPVEFGLNSWSVSPLMDDAFELRYHERLKAGKDDAPTLEDAKLAPALAAITYKFGGDNKGVTQTLRLGKKTVAGKAYLQKGSDPRIYVVDANLHRLVLDQKINDWRKRSLEGPKEANVKQVSLSQGIKSIGAIKTNGVWSLMGPHSGRADLDTISGILKAIDSIYVDKFVADSPDDLAPFGLDYPKLKLTVTFSDNKVKTFCIGSAVDLSADAKLYATWDRGTAAGSIIFTISKSEAEKFDKTVNQLRDARITPIDAIGVSKMTIKQPGDKVINLEKGADGWTFTQPLPDFAADDENIGKLVEALTTAKAKDYSPNVEIKIPHEVEVKLTATGRSEPDILKIFALDKETKRRMVIRNNETTGYLVPGSEVGGAFEPVLALRNRLIEDISRDVVNQIEIKRPDGRHFKFSRKLDAKDPKKDPGDWGMQGHEKFESSALQSLMFDLVPIRAESWVTNKDRPLTQLFEITIGAVNGAAAKLTIDAKDNLATMEGLKPVFKVQDTLVKKITTEFEYRQVLDLKAEDIKQLTVARDGRVVTITKGEDGKYAGTKDEKINQSAAGGMFDTLAGLRVESFINQLNLPSRQILQQIDLITKDGKSHKLVFSSRKGQENAVGLDDRWFILDEDSLKKLKEKVLE